MRVALAIIAVLWAARPAAAQLVASGTSLTVSTTNATATFAGPDLVGFVNRVTGESYLTNPSTGELAGVNAFAGGGALTASNWIVGTEPGTGHPAATITATGAGRSLTLAVKIDTVSQEIVLRLQASSASPGLRDASWSIAGLDVDHGRLIVPAHSGVVFDRRHPGIGEFLQYPNTWQAQMAVYETGLGSVVLYSTDQAMSFKQLRINTRGASTLDVALATEATAPFASATAVPAVEWRMKAFSGDWRIAAETYRQWLLTNRPPVPNTAHPWVSNIRSVVLIAPDAALLAPVAAQLTPSQTLLYVSDWRRDGYDVNYPDYTPRVGVAAFIASAHALGFKVMLHTDLIGVSSYSADYPPLQPFQVKTSESLEPMGWQWQKPASTPYRFAYINPAAAAFRSLFIARLAPHITALAPDALHLDISAPMYNDGNGIIEGRTYPQGSAKLHEELIAAFPTVALAGEGENDVLYRYQSFAQAWHFAVGPPGHPITTFLFSPQVLYYGHLSQPPARDPQMKRELVELEQRAVQPLLSVWGPSDIDTTDRDVARLVNILKAWQNHAFTPAWNTPWGSARVRYQGLAGALAEFNETPTITSLTAAGASLFQIAHDTTYITTPSFIAGWPAFDSTTLYGLDRSQTYYLEPLPRPTTSTRVVVLPTQVQLGDGTMIGSSFARVELKPAVAATFDFMALTDARPGVRFNGLDTPMGNGAVVQSSAIVAGGVTRSGVFIHPPWQGQIGGETFVEYAVAIPTGSSLRFAVAVADNANCTDGVTFRVTIDGVERWSRHVLRTGWLEAGVDLASYSGRTIALRLISHPGPANNPNCDWSQWSDVAIDAAPSTALIDVPLVLAAGSSIAGFDGDGTLSTSSPSSANVRMPVPGAFTLFTANGTPVSSGVNLANVPFTVWQAGVNALPRLGSAFGAGSVYTGSSGGVTKTPAIAAHPPTGRTILAWVARLPTQPLKLSWSAGLADGRVSFDGVDFLVRVNGVVYWRRSATAPQWMSGSIDLARWKDQNVLIELVTDMRVTYWDDASHWADLVFAPADTTCSYGVPSALSVGREGGQLSVNVTTTPACPWAAVSSVPWLTVASGAGSGLGNGTASLLAAPNPSGARSGTLVIAGNVVSVTQDGALTPPLSANDAHSTMRGTTLSIGPPGVLLNDDARGGGAMVATLITQATHGTVTLTGNGGFSYTPVASFVGTDSFTYQAVSAAGPGNIATVTVTVVDPPTLGPQPPTGLYVSAMSGSTVTIRFTPPATGPPTTSFMFEGGITPGQILATMPIGLDPIFTFTAPSGAFYIRVFTMSGVSRSAPSNEIRIFVNTPAVPSAPANLVATINQSSLALAWRNTFAGGEPTSLMLDVAGTITTSLPLALSDSFAFNGVPPGTYVLSVRALNANGSSTASNPVTLTFPSACTGVPLPPTNFLAYRIGATIFVVWEPPVTGPAPASYLLNVSGAFAGSFPASGRSMSGTVGPGTYRLSVAAVNACGVSGATATQMVTVP